MRDGRAVHPPRPTPRGKLRLRAYFPESARRFVAGAGRREDHPAHGTDKPRLWGRDQQTDVGLICYSILQCAGA